jgi:hypothetical protein
LYKSIYIIENGSEVMLALTYYMTTQPLFVFLD